MLRGPPSSYQLAESEREPAAAETGAEGAEAAWRELGPGLWETRVALPSAVRPSLPGGQLRLRLSADGRPSVRLLGRDDDDDDDEEDAVPLAAFHPEAESVPSSPASDDAPDFSRRFALPAGRPFPSSPLNAFHLN